MAKNSEDYINSLRNRISQSRNNDVNVGEAVVIASSRTFTRAINDMDGTSALKTRYEEQTYSDYDGILDIDYSLISESTDRRLSDVARSRIYRNPNRSEDISETTTSERKTRDKSQSSTSDFEGKTLNYNSESNNSKSNNSRENSGKIISREAFSTRRIEFLAKQRNNQRSAKLNTDSEGQVQAQPQRKILGIKKLEPRTVKLPRGHKKYQNPYKSDKEIDKLAKEISKNIQKRIQKEDREIKRENAKTKRTLRKPKAKKNVHFRYTDPKKRLLISRLLLAYDYDHGHFSDIAKAYRNGEYTFEEVEESKNATKRRDRRLYKELQQYEDIRDDVKARAGYKALVCGLAGIALAACIAIPIKGINYITNDIAARAEVHQMQPISYETAEDIQIEMADKTIADIKENTDYRFSNLSQIQMEDAILRIPAVLSKTPETTFNSYSMKFSDQLLLDKLLSRAYEYEKDGVTYSEYDTFSAEEKLDLKQLLYEYMGQKDEFMKVRSLVRSPEGVERLIEGYNNATQNGGARANPGTVAGYGATKGWNGERCRIDRNSDGTITVVYLEPKHEFNAIENQTRPTGETTGEITNNSNDELTR